MTTKEYIAQPEVYMLLKEFIANPNAGFARNSKGEPTGLTQVQQTMCVVKVITETIFTEHSTEQYAQLIQAVHAFANGSAVRQVMEKPLGVGQPALLGESVGGKRGLDVESLVKKYGQDSVTL